MTSKSVIYLYYLAQIQVHHSYSLQNFVTQLLPNHSKYHPKKKEVNKISLKATPTTVTINKSQDVQNASIADATTTNNNSDRAWI